MDGRSSSISKREWTCISQATLRASEFSGRIRSNTFREHGFKFLVMDASQPIESQQSVARDSLPRASDLSAGGELPRRAGAPARQANTARPARQTVTDNGEAN